MSGPEHSQDQRSIAPGQRGRKEPAQTAGEDPEVRAARFRAQVASWGEPAEEAVGVLGDQLLVGGMRERMTKQKSSERNAAVSGLRSAGLDSDQINTVLGHFGLPELPAPRPTKAARPPQQRRGQPPGKRS